MDTAAAFATKLRTPGPVIGSWLGIPHPIVAEAMSQIGMDYILADGEHGAVNPQDLLQVLPAADRFGKPVVYRVPFNRPEYIKAALDTGAAAVMVPMVNTVEEAKAAVALTKYPPLGTRGMGAWRASNYYQNGRDYMKRANQETSAILQIETVEAINNIEAIAAVPGIDVLYLGPGDLALSQGVEPGLLHLSLIEAYRRVVAAGRKNGVKVGIDVANVDFMKEYVRLGIEFLSFKADFGLILDAGKRISGEMRACFSEE